MVMLIKKGGLRERANRSRFYKGSENTETTLQPNRYPKNHLTTEENSSAHSQVIIQSTTSSEQENCIHPQPNSKA